MDLICHCTNVCVLILEIFKCQTISIIPSHWGQQEDLESPQVARLPQKSLVKVPNYLKWWNQWNQMQHGSDEITFILLNIIFCNLDPVPASIRSLDFISLPWALAKLHFYRCWRSALVPVASESKCMRQVARKARSVGHWVLLLGPLEFFRFYLRKLFSLSVAVQYSGRFFVWTSESHSQSFDRCITRMGQCHRLQHCAHVPQHGAHLRARHHSRDVSGRRRSSSGSGPRNSSSGASSHGYSYGGKRTKRHSDPGGSFKFRSCLYSLSHQGSGVLFFKMVVEIESETFARVFCITSWFMPAFIYKKCWYKCTDISWNILMTYVDTSSMPNAGAKPQRSQRCHGPAFDQGTGSRLEVWECQLVTYWYLRFGAS